MLFFSRRVHLTSSPGFQVPSMLSASLMPKSVQEAEELIRSTFGEMVQQSKIKEIAANLRLGMVMDDRINGFFFVLPHVIKCYELLFVSQMVIDG
jgi:hypothetical protein